MTQEEFEEKYKGKTVLGFEFSGSPGFNDDMRRYVGVDGLVVSARTSDLSSRYVFRVSFEDGEEWLYPADECIRQIEENNKSEEDLYIDIRKLLIKI
jgi:hypothetical protein